MSTTINADASLKLNPGINVTAKQAEYNCSAISQALQDGNAVELTRGSEYCVAPGIYGARDVGGKLFCHGKPTFQQSSLEAVRFGHAIITRIDSDVSTAERDGVLNEVGPGFETYGIEYRGRPYTYDYYGEGAVGDPSDPIDTAKLNPKPKSFAGICLQSYNTRPLVMLPIVHDCLFSEVADGVRFEGSHWARGATHVPCEANCDNADVANCVFSNCDSGVVLANQQSVAISVYKPCVFGWGGRSLNDFTLVKAQRGGDVDVYSPSLNHQRMTLFESRDFDINGRGFSCYGGRWDHVPIPGDDPYLCAFRYTGITWTGMHDVRYAVRVHGMKTNNMHIPSSWDPEKSLSVPLDAATGFPIDDIYVDIQALGAHDTTLQDPPLNWPSSKWQTAYGPYLKPRYTS